jgi:predicted permease
MLEVRGLVKYYSHTPALRGVSFAIRPGEILGCLGPNGAGKSTIVKILTGLIEPSEGRIFYNGRSVQEDFTAFQSRIGYVPEEAHLYPHLSSREYLQLSGRLRGLTRAALEPKMDEFLRLFGLWSDRHAPLASYSKGMRQKILLSAALLHDPDILILDEPFSGLDVTSALLLRTLLGSLAERGKIVLYSSHVLEVVEKVCSNVLILRQGEVVAYDSIERLRELMSQPSLEAVFSQLAQVDDGKETAARILRAMSSAPPPEPARPVATGLRLYRAIASAYPQEFQNAYGDEMLQMTEECIEPVWRRHGVLGLFRLLLDLAIRLPVEYFAEFRQDVRHGLRALRSAPGFTIVALLSLALGICVATCAFTEMNGFVLRDVPGVAHPGELVLLTAPVSYPDFERYRARGDLFADSLAFAAPVPLLVSTGGPAERLWGHIVSASYFSTLGVRPALGRFFARDEEIPGRAPNVVIGYPLWRNRLGSNTAVIGSTIRVNGQPCRVIGVAPEGFAGASPLTYGADLWLPVGVSPQVAPELAGNAPGRRDAAIFHMLGRLRPSVPQARAEAALDTMARQLEQEFGAPDRNKPGRRVALLPGGKLLPIQKKDLPMFTAFFVLLGGIILLIASSNVAHMLIARATARRREIAVRLAIGAGRGRLVRQLLTESALIAAGAGVVGFVLSAGIMHLASGERIPAPMPIQFDYPPDWRVLLFTFALTCFTGLAFGLIPALQATRTDLSTALKEGGNIQLPRFRRLSLRNTLVLSQVAGSLGLLLITGVLVIGHRRLSNNAPTFDPHNVYLVSLDLPRDGYSPARAHDFVRTLTERLRRNPSVASVGVADSIPMTMMGKPAAQFSVPQPGGGSALQGGRRYSVDRDFFATLGIPILRGRAFRPDDESDDSTAAIVSEKLARLCWPNQDPLGRRIETGEEPPPTFFMSSGPRATLANSRTLEVVGVTKDIRDGLSISAADAPPILYLPLRPADYGHASLYGINILLRAAPGFDALTLARHEIESMDGNMQPYRAAALTEQIEELLFPVNVALWTYAFIGIFGLILTCVGLAGITAYSVTQRRREIGIRMALGAGRSDVLGLVMKEGFLLVVLGSAAGLLMARAALRLLSAVLEPVTRATGNSINDPALMIGAPLLLAAVALAACYLPARQSLRIHPAVSLRQE